MKIAGQQNPRDRKSHDYLIDEPRVSTDPIGSVGVNKEEGEPISSLYGALSTRVTQY